MGFLVYDIIFFALSILAVSLFFYKKRKNFKIEGPLYLYRTKFGIKLIDSSSKRYKKLLSIIEYLVIFSGYALMVLGTWFIIKVAYIYLTSPYLAKALKVPVIFPLVPYLPEVFKLSFLPPFYFTYWIIIIAIIAIPHEFAHGIYSRFHKIKVHSTGFGFLRIFKLPTPFLAAFVEPDEKQMEKKGIRRQLSVIAAGTFANILVGIIFLILMWIFLSLAFTPAGVQFSTYALNIVPISEVTAIDGLPIKTPFSIDSLASQQISSISTSNQTFIPKQSILDGNNVVGFYVYENSPAFKANLSGAIQYIDDYKIYSYQNLKSVLQSYKPGDSVVIKTIKDNEIKEYSLILGDREGGAYLGIGIIPQRNSGILGWIYSLAAKVKDPSIYYESILGDFGIFIYELIWWIIIVSFSVALMNMLPLGIFDGGKFFYLTVLLLTKNKSLSEKAFKFITLFFLAILAVLMIKWVLIFFT